MQNGFKPLIIFDFDRTIADTFSPSPSGIGVAEAYDLAVRNTFGQEGHYLYETLLGGLQNREPGELVDEIGGKAVELGIELPYFATRKDAIRALVGEKIRLLLPDFSTKWPLPLPGVKEFFHKVAKGQLPVETAIVSSGHDEAIRKFFAVNDLTPPRIMITSDTIRDLTEPKRPLYKPEPYQVARAHHEWLLQKPKDYQSRKDTGKPHILVIGDDPKKDGELAYRARIPFGIVPFSNPHYEPDAAKGQFRLNDFNHLTQILANNQQSLLEGQSMSQIFLGVSDQELFPRVTAQERPYAQWLEQSNSGKRERL